MQLREVKPEIICFCNMFHKKWGNSTAVLTAVRIGLTFLSCWSRRNYINVGVTSDLPIALSAIADHLEGSSQQHTKGCLYSVYMSLSSIHDPFL